MHRPESPRHRLPFPPMPSGKRARQQRQAAAATAPPPVRSKGVGGARARQASPRALAIGGGIALAIVIAIVLGVVLSSRGGSGGGGGGVVNVERHAEPAGDSEARSWAGAVPGRSRGEQPLQGHSAERADRSATRRRRSTMEMFIDVQCPVCDDYEVNHLPLVVNKYIRARERCSCTCSRGPSSDRSRSPAGWASSPPLTRTRASSTRRCSTTISGAGGTPAG